MTENVLTVTMYGFWSELQRSMIPQKQDLYFVFAGVIVGGGFCKLLRTLYIGLGDSGPEMISSEKVDQLKDQLSEGESLFFAVGEVTHDAELAKSALMGKAMPIETVCCSATQGVAKPCSIHLEGKVPAIYKGFCDFDAFCAGAEVKQ